MAEENKPLSSTGKSHYPNPLPASSRCYLVDHAFTNDADNGAILAESAIAQICQILLQSLNLERKESANGK